MKPVHQTIISADYGNCMQACVASILERELGDVPNFMGAGDDKYEDMMEIWLKDQPFNILTILVKGNEEISNRNLKDTYVIAVGKSPTYKGVNHAVVYYNGEMVHDPNPEGKGIKGNPEYYDVFVIKDPVEIYKLRNYYKRAEDYIKVLEERMEEREQELTKNLKAVPNEIDKAALEEIECIKESLKEKPLSKE